MRSLKKTILLSILSLIIIGDVAVFFAAIRDSRLAAEPSLAVLLGSEGDGLKQETIEKSDYVIKIPMSNNVDSLNVAAASAVAFWELGNN